ncbi:hypothetical protein FKM82_020310 [Ascaphus truei]
MSTSENTKLVTFCSRFALPDASYINSLIQLEVPTSINLPSSTPNLRCTQYNKERQSRHSDYHSVLATQGMVSLARQHGKRQTVGMTDIS